ncbi:PEGA domain protein [uncultured archaeon]|nr:PEGA domain protein [uncultured archaeon]
MLIWNRYTSYLSVTSLPSGAIFYLNGNFQGTTPKTIDNIAVGTYTITLKLDGYQDWSQTVEVVDWKGSDISASLVSSTPIATPSPIGDKFRVGPSVTLRPVTDVIDNNQDAIVELFMNDPSLNDVALNVDIRVSLPTGIHVYGEGFGQGAGAGVVGGTYRVSPGTSRTIILVIKADKSASIGLLTLQFTGVYWPGNNKDNFQPISLRYPVTVKEPSNNPENLNSKVVPSVTYTPTKTSITIVATPYSLVPPYSEPETNWAMIGGIGLLILLGIIAISRPKTKDKSPKVIEEPMFDKKPVLKGINITSAFGYKGATILYKVKVGNTSPSPIADIKVSLFVPNVFLILEKDKSLSLLKPGESKTVTFEIRPTGECGDCEVSGKIAYYDTGSNRTKEIDIDSKMLSIICPMLKVKEISEVEWHNIVSNLIETEESTTEIDMPAETLFNITSRIIKDMHMYMLTPEITQDQKLFNGVARFYCEGVKGLRYASQIEVVGGARKSKLILKAWAEKEDALTGFYHGLLDEIEKRVKVKEFIEDSIVQYNVHIGDKIGTLVKDSVIQRSNIGANARKCPNCGREVEANEKFCLECGAKL